MWVALAALPPRCPGRYWRVVGSPAIRGEYLKINAEMQDALAAAIGERTGTDMYPQILAGAVIAATQVAIWRWFRADPPEPLLPIIELALRQLTSVSAEYVMR